MGYADKVDIVPYEMRILESRYGRGHTSASRAARSSSRTLRINVIRLDRRRDGGFSPPVARPFTLPRDVDSEYDCCRAHLCYFFQQPLARFPVSV